MRSKKFALCRVAKPSQRLIDPNQHAASGNPACEGELMSRIASFPFVQGGEICRFPVAGGREPVSAAVDLETVLSR